MLPKRILLDSLGEPFRELSLAIESGKDSVVLSCAEEARQHLTSVLNRFFVYVIPDHINARRIAENLSELSGGDVSYLDENDDILIFNKINKLLTLPSRINTIFKLCENRLDGLVVTAQGLTQLLPNRKVFKDNIVKIERGKSYDIYALTEKLVKGGYTRKDFVENKGEFKIVGDTVEVFSLTEEMPYRIEFDFDTVDKIKVFSPDSMVTIKTIDVCEFCPTRDILLTENDRDMLRRRLFSIQKKTKQSLYDIIEQILETIDTADVAPNNWILPLVRDKMSTLFDYLPDNALIVFNEPKIIEDKWKVFYNTTKSRVNDFFEGGTNIKEHIESILSVDELRKGILPFTKLAFMQDNMVNALFEAKNVQHIKALSITKYTFNLNQLFVDVKNYTMNGMTVFICVNPMASAEIIRENLRNNEIFAEIYRDNLDKIEHFAGVSLLVTQINASFCYPNEKVVFIGNDKIATRTEKRIKSDKEKRQAFILPENGDFVVHDKHGIGVSEGIKKVETSNGIREFYIVRYKDDDRLYLPVDQMDHLEKYSGKDHPSIHRLGSKDFEKVKQRVKKAIKEMAIDLLALYEKRLNQKGYKYPEDTPFQQEMEDKFEYTETNDQLVAVDEIKRDMEKGKIMDRLLCGDVGFGKTEVAIRAIFKTVMENKQVAMLSPTTILSNQHFNTIKARLNEYGLKIVLLNRFVQQHIMDKSLEEISSGAANIVIGTHRILSQDVVFSDLGLLVVDEEQKFGVTHKEKIKTLKTNINVLALSATPIPRTLHMSLSGIRDISVLDTPPSNRMPIQTYLVEYTQALLIDAVKREVARGGQVYILFNRVQGIARFADEVSEMLGSEISVIYAHGQMEANDLEERIDLFYKNEVQVLISTTIIENGIDLPNANTLIVINSENFGLSQLYQLKGRVGRSNTQAYAYFTYPSGKSLSEDAMRRLNALNTYTELGSGFKIAMEDMNIRGSGNVLGAEQSGEMERVGYDLYCKLLEESINEIRGIRSVEKKDVEINVEGDSSLPEKYIIKQTERIKFYKRVAILDSIEKRAELLRDLEDIYHYLPESVLLLINIGLIKNLAQGINIKKVIINKKVFSIHFYQNDIYQNEKLFKAIDRRKIDATLVPINPPIINLADKNATPLEKSDYLVDFLQEAQPERIDN